MSVNKVLLDNAFNMFDVWGDEAITDSSRSKTIIKTVQRNTLWESFEGLDKAALFVRHLSKGVGGQRGWMPAGLLRFITSVSTDLKALYYVNGIVCYDEGQHYLESEWITYCHPMSIQEFKKRLKI